MSDIILPVLEEGPLPGAAALPLPPASREEGETMQEFVFRRLRTAIMTGWLPPGRAITIRGLAASLDVSAMPVREAMRRLAAERALDVLDNRRVRVPAMTPERFESLIDTRILLEMEAGVRALPEVNEARLQSLRRLEDGAEQARRSGDVEEAIASNFAFHHRLYTYARNDVLMPLIESVWLQIGPFMRAFMRPPPGTDRGDRHRDILAALAAHDRHALRHAIERDIRDGLNALAAA